MTLNEGKIENEQTLYRRNEYFWTCIDSARLYTDTIMKTCLVSYCVAVCFQRYHLRVWLLCFHLFQWNCLYVVIKLSVCGYIEILWLQIFPCGYNILVCGYRNFNELIEISKQLYDSDYLIFNKCLWLWKTELTEKYIYIGYWKLFL